MRHKYLWYAVWRYASVILAACAINLLCAYWIYTCYLEHPESAWLDRCLVTLNVCVALNSVRLAAKTLWRWHLLDKKYGDGTGSGQQ